MTNPTRLTIEIDPKIKRQYKGYAACEGKNLTEKTIDLINRYLEESDK